MGKGKEEVGGRGGGKDVQVKFSDLNTKSSIFDLRAESVNGDPALRSGAFGGGIFHYLPPPTPATH